MAAKYTVVFQGNPSTFWCGHAHRSRKAAETCRRSWIRRIHGEHADADRFVQDRYQVASA